MDSNQPRPHPEGDATAATPPQAPPGWPSSPPPRGPARPGYQAWGAHTGPAPSWQPAAPPARRGGMVAAIVAGVVAAVLLVGGAAWFAWSVFGGPAPATPTGSGGVTSASTGTQKDFRFTDAPAQVGRWTAQETPEGLPGMYYTTDEESEFGGDLMISLGVARSTLESLRSDLDNVTESSGGRVVCGDWSGVYSCYVSTREFAVVFVTPAVEDVPHEDVVLVADAIAAAHP